MKRILLRTAAASLILPLMLCGCEQLAPVEETTTTAATTTQITTTSAVTTTQPTTTTTVKTPPATEHSEGNGLDGVTEVYSIYKFTDEYNEFLSKVVFVGDSICSGIGIYDLIKSDHMLAKGNIAARSIMDYTFNINGKELNAVEALEAKQPEYIAFFMGMNDVNMTSAEQYAENYRQLLTNVQKVCPDSVLMVISTSPISVTSKFTKNEYIDEQNEAARKMIAENESETNKWYYINAAKELKNSANGMKTNYQSDDGVHVIKAGHEAILWALCHQMLDPPDPEAPQTSEVTTSATTTKAPVTTTKTTTSKKAETTTVTTTTKRPAVTTAPESSGQARLDDDTTPQARLED